MSLQGPGGPPVCTAWRSLRVCWPRRLHATRLAKGGPAGSIPLRLRKRQSRPWSPRRWSPRRYVGTATSPSARSATASKLGRYCSPTDPGASQREHRASGVDEERARRPHGVGRPQPGDEAGAARPRGRQGGEVVVGPGAGPYAFVERVRCEVRTAGPCDGAGLGVCLGLRELVGCLCLGEDGAAHAASTSTSAAEPSAKVRCSTPWRTTVTAVMSGVRPIIGVVRSPGVSDRRARPAPWRFGPRGERGSAAGRDRRSTSRSRCRRRG
jgi:hypothetical protein